MGLLVLPTAVSTMCQVVPLLAFAGYLLLRHRKSQAALWLAAFCIGFSSMQLGWAISELIPPTRLTMTTFAWILGIGGGAMLPMAIAFLQFGYAVRGNVFRREARAMLWFQLAAYFAIASAMILSNESVVSKLSGIGFQLNFLATLAVSVWTPAVLYRKARFFERRGPASGASARACLAFARISLAWAVLITSALFTWAIPFAQEFFFALVTAATFLFVYSLIITYATHVEERTTLQVKLVGAVLATILLFLSLVTNTLFSNTGLAGRTATTIGPHDIVFTPAGNSRYTYDVVWAADSTMAPVNDAMLLSADTTIAIGFTFPFFDVPWDSVAVNTDGLLTFGGSAQSSASDALQLRELYVRLPAVIPLLTEFEKPVRVEVQSTDTALTLQWRAAPLHLADADNLLFVNATLFATGQIRFSYRSHAGLPQAGSIAMLGGRGIHRGLDVEETGWPATVRFRPGDPKSSNPDVELIEDFALEAFLFADVYGRRLFWLMLGASVFCLVVIPFVFRLSVLQPVDRLLSGVESVERGDLTVRVDLPNQDEIGELARHFNSMTERIQFNQRQLALHAEELENRVRERTAELHESMTNLRAAQEQLVQQEKLASLGSLTAGIAHEIKNPLNFVNNFAELSTELLAELVEAIKNGEPIDELVADLSLNTRQIASHGRRADSIVRSMMLHAAGGTGDVTSVDVNAFVDEYVALAYHGMRAQDPNFNVTIERDYQDDVGQVTLVPQDIGRVLLNILGNAFYAIRAHRLEAKPETDTEPAPTVWVSTASSGDQVTITIRDNGPGIPEEILKKVFEPFFTTKPTGDGTGLGLSLSHEIVTKGHGGSLVVENAPEGGARFVITLPRSPKDLT